LIFIFTAKTRPFSHEKEIRCEAVSVAWEAERTPSVMVGLKTLPRFEAAPSPRPSPIGWERVFAKTGEGCRLGSSAVIRFQLVASLSGDGTGARGKSFRKNFLPVVQEPEENLRTFEAQAEKPEQAPRTPNASRWIAGPEIARSVWSATGLPALWVQGHKTTNP